MNELTTPRALCIVLRSSVAKHIINAITIRCVYSARVSQCHFHFLYIYPQTQTRALDAREERPPPPPPLFSATPPAEFAFALYVYASCIVSEVGADFRRLANCSPPQRVRQCAKSVAALFRIGFPQFFALPRFCACGKRLLA